MLETAEGAQETIEARADVLCPGPQGRMGSRDPFAALRVTRRIGDERALALLAEDVVRRRSGREGIVLEGARFVAAELKGYGGPDATVFPDPAGAVGVVQ